MRTVQEIETEINVHRTQIDNLKAERNEAQLYEFGVKVGDAIPYEGANYLVAGIRYGWVIGHPEKQGGGWSKNTKTLYHFKGAKK